jgi:hypothetical protein
MGSTGLGGRSLRGWSAGRAARMRRQHRQRVEIVLVRNDLPSSSTVKDLGGEGVGAGGALPGRSIARTIRPCWQEGAGGTQPYGRLSLERRCSGAGYRPAALLSVVPRLPGGCITLHTAKA